MSATERLTQADWNQIFELLPPASSDREALACVSRALGTIALEFQKYRSLRSAIVIMRKHNGSLSLEEVIETLFARHSLASSSRVSSLERAVSKNSVATLQWFYEQPELRGLFFQRVKYNACDSDHVQEFGELEGTLAAAALYLRKEKAFLWFYNHPDPQIRSLAIHGSCLEALVVRNRDIDDDSTFGFLLSCPHLLFHTDPRTGMNIVHYAAYYSDYLLDLLAERVENDSRIEKLFQARTKEGRSPATVAFHSPRSSASARSAVLETLAGLPESCRSTLAMPEKYLCSTIWSNVLVFLAYDPLDSGDLRHLFTMETAPFRECSRKCNKLGIAFFYDQIFRVRYFISKNRRIEFVAIEAALSELFTIPSNTAQVQQIRRLLDGLAYEIHILSTYLKKGKEDVFMPFLKLFSFFYTYGIFSSRMNDILPLMPLLLQMLPNSPLCFQRMAFSLAQSTEHSDTLNWFKNSMQSPLKVPFRVKESSAAALSKQPQKLPLPTSLWSYIFDFLRGSLKHIETFESITRVSHAFNTLLNARSLKGYNTLKYLPEPPARIGLYPLVKNFFSCSIPLDRPIGCSERTFCILSPKESTSYAKFLEKRCVLILPITIRPKEHIDYEPFKKTRIWLLTLLSFVASPKSILKELRRPENDEKFLLSMLPNAPDTLLGPALAAATYMGYLGVLKWFYENRPEIYESTVELLFFAAHNNHLHVLDWALSQPELFFLFQQSRQNLLLHGFAIQSANLDVLKWLISRTDKRMIDLIAQSNISHCFTVFTEGTVALDHLLNISLPGARAAIFQLDPQGNNLVHYAINYGRIDILESLKKGSMVQTLRLFVQKNNAGKTPIDSIPEEHRAKLEQWIGKQLWLQKMLCVKSPS